MTADMPKPQAEQGGQNKVPGTALEPVRPPVAKLQPVLVATVIGAIILAIAIGSFWTTF